MGWFKVDDQLAFNAKVILAGNSAMGLWVRAGSWSSAQLTGGFVPAHMASTMANPMANPCDPDALVNAGLWSEADGGFQFHDWAEFQPDAEVEKAKRKATSDARSRAGKAGAKARWASKADGKPMASASAENGKPMPPTRPDPLSKERVNATPPNPEQGQVGSRIPRDFKATTEMTAWALENAPTADTKTGTQKFKLYYQSAAGKNQFRTDWQAAWELWMLNDHTRNAPPKPPNTTPSPWDRMGTHD